MTLAVLPKTQGMDPITLEVIRHALEGIAEEMNVGLMRAAYSTNITDRRDSSCAVYLPHGEPVAQSESGTPLHLGVMPAVVENVLAHVPTTLMRPGDHYLVNTPYPQGPGHLNDLTLIHPVFFADEVVALVANQAHHVDVGGMAPGSMPANSTEIFQEGLQIPPVALVREGVIVPDVLSIFLANIRTPDTSRGDLLAQIAANRVGSERVEALIRRWGIDALQRAMHELLNQAERRMRNAIRVLPDGEYKAEDTLEGPEGPLTIKVTLRIDGDNVTADFAGTDPQVRAPLNCRPATVRACLVYVAVAMLDPSASPSAGTLRPLRVNAPEGCLLNATYPASLVHSNVVTSQRICDALIRAFNAAAPEQGIAACSGIQGLVCIGGFDPNRNEPFTYIETHGGGMGARRGYDGQSAVHTNMTNTLNSPVEVLEQSFPFRVLEYSLRPDSEGAGRHRGGFGMRKSIQVQVSVTITIAADRVESQPWGLEGGGAAAPARIYLDRGGTVQALKSRETLRLDAGDILTLMTPGGGGWGSARERLQHTVAVDVANELISVERAAEIYADSADQ